MNKRFTTGLSPTPGLLFRRAGFTIVELIVSIGVGSIVLMAMVMFFVNSNRSYLNQDEIIVMNQNLRLAMDSVARDARMAGSGLGFFAKSARRIYISYDGSVSGSYNPPCYPSSTGAHAARASDGNYGIVPVDSCDGGANNSDGVGLFGFLPYMGNPLGATSGYTGQNNIQGSGWNEDIIDDFRIKTASNLAVAVVVDDGSQYKPRVFVTSGQASTTSEANNTYTFNLPISSSGNLHKLYNTGAYSEGGPYGSSENYYTYVMGDFFWLHYFIDKTDETNPQLKLWARHLGVEGQEELVVSNAIEDLQLRYFVDDDETTEYDSLTSGGIDLDKNQVTALKVALVARTERPSSTGGRFRPVQLYNHVPAATADGFRRQTLETMVYLRNTR